MSASPPQPPHPSGDLAAPQPLGFGRRLAKMLGTLSLAGAMLTLLALVGHQPTQDTLSPFLLDADAIRAGQLWRLLTVHLVAPNLIGFALTFIIGLMLSKQVEEQLSLRGWVWVTLGTTLAGSGGALAFSQAPQWTHGLVLGYAGATLGYIYTDRGSLRAFLTDGGVLRFLFFLAMLVALDLTAGGGLDPGRWIACGVGLLLGIPLTRGLWPSDRDLLIARVQVGAIFGGIALLLALGLAPELMTRLAAGVATEPAERALRSPELPATEARAPYQRLAESLASEPPSTRRGAARLLAGELDGAREDLLQATKARPADALAWALLGRAHLAASNRLDAREALLEAERLGLAAERPELHYWLAKVARGDEVGARRAALEAAAAEDSGLRDLLAALTGG